jgi:hypothetical protein
LDGALGKQHPVRSEPDCRGVPGAQQQQNAILRTQSRRAKPRPSGQVPQSLFVHVASMETHWLRIAMATAWALSLAFSLRRIALMWFFIVCSLIPST